MFLSLFRFSLAVAAATIVMPNRAGATIYVGAGADSIALPVVQAEFNLVYAGQVFSVTGTDSQAAQQGFLTNDCTFGGTQSCTWSPLGNAAIVDVAYSIIPLTAAQIRAYTQSSASIDGPLIQLPRYATALAIAAQNRGLTSNGQLALDDGELCGIFSGQLTDWSQFSDTAAPGGFTLVYDTQPGSGATWLLTQHLHAVCNGNNSAFTTLPVPVTSDFKTLPVPGGVAGSPEFQGAAGNTGMQAALLSGSSAIGYIGPSYTSIAPSSAVTSSLVVATLQNGVSHGLFQPNSANTLVALRHPGAGAINTVAPTTPQSAAMPMNWAPQIPNPATGYPIVGYVNLIASTCYNGIGPILVQYLTKPYLPTQHQLVIAQDQFVPAANVNSTYARALNADFFNNGSGDNLNIEDAQVCASLPGR